MNPFPQCPVVLTGLHCGVCVCSPRSLLQPVPPLTIWRPSTTAGSHSAVPHSRWPLPIRRARPSRFCPKRHRAESMASRKPRRLPNRRVPRAGPGAGCPWAPVPGRSRAGEAGAGGGGDGEEAPRRHGPAAAPGPARGAARRRGARPGTGEPLWGGLGSRCVCWGAASLGKGAAVSVGAALALGAGGPAGLAGCA